MRTMCAVVLDEDKAFVSDPSDETHVKWLLRIGVLNGLTDPKFEGILRGHLAMGCLTMYQGTRFRMPEQTIALRGRLRQFMTELDIPRVKPVRIGVIDIRLKYAEWKVWSLEEIAADPTPVQSTANSAKT
jgi:hypothetical protein